MAQSSGNQSPKRVYTVCAGMEVKPGNYVASV